MPDDQNTTQNIDTSDSPPTPEATGGQAPLTTPSDTVETPPEVLNAPTDGFTPESPNNPLDTSNADTGQAENEEKSSQNSDSPSADAEAGADKQTAQIPVNEPFEDTQDKPLTENKSSLARQLLISARNALQFRKRKKLDRVMSLFEPKNGSTSSPRVTNDEVEKLLHVSDATATRYLSELEKEGKIKQNGKTGHAVSYSRI